MVKEISYDNWHEARQNDNDVDTPWYNFVKTSLAPEDTAGKNILEIGCGRGGFSNYLIRSFPGINRLYACDYSASGIEIGKNNSASDRIVWQQENIEQLSFADNTFDTIISCETIEHIRHPGKGLSELSRVLKPGGRLLLTCPNYFNFFGIWCLYRKIIGRPFTEGGQPYVNYLQLPHIYTKLWLLGMRVVHFHTTELVIPNRVPRTYYHGGVPYLLRFLGSRTFYVLVKKGR